MITVKKKRAIGLTDGVPAPLDPHADDANRAPRIFRVPTVAFAESDDHGGGANVSIGVDGQSFAESGSSSPTEVESNRHSAVQPLQPAQRRARRTSTIRSGPVSTIVAAPTSAASASASAPVNLAALALELEVSMNAKAHAAEQAQLDRLQQELGTLDSVLALIAKARAFTLADMQLSTQWQQLTQAARGLAESVSPAQPSPTP